jgi:hypothetical protein
VERARSSLIYRTLEEFARGIGGEKEFEEGATGKSKNQSSVPAGNPEAPAAT